MNIPEQIRYYQDVLPKGVELVAVSKFHSCDEILQAYIAGQRVFGESRVQEFVEKFKILPKDIKWHFIGHLQSNKVKPVIGKTTLIESVDSEKLLGLIDRESHNAGEITDVLLQVHIAAEETKFGFLPDELINFIREGKFKTLSSIRIRGIMGMATNTDSLDIISNDFRNISAIYEECRNMPQIDPQIFNCLSMGMSGDWKIAIKFGANIVRIGSSIFGERNY